MARTIAEQLGDYAAAELARSLTGEVTHHAKRALIDWFAALMPGTAIDPARALMAALDDEIGQGGAWVYGLGRRAPIRTAALINGTASHAVEFDDIFRDAVYHPGCPVIAAALAAAQARGATPAELLKAIVIGYETSTRIGVAVQPSHYKYWHTTGTVGTFGAAVAVGAILKLSANQMAHAIGTAGTMAAALQQAFRSDAMSKPLHAGHAAEAGALAALGAAKGMTGALDVLEGEAGFGRAMSTTADWSKAIDGLGTRYNITRMTFKNHGCCGHAFAAIDGAQHLQRSHQINLDDIREIAIGGYRATVEVAGMPEARTPFEGKFSTAFLVSSALVHGSVRLNAYTPERLADPKVNALMKTVRLGVDEECAAAFPAIRSAKVAITLKDGTSVSHFQRTRIGDPDAPLSDAQVSDKFMELAGPVLGGDVAKRTLAALWECAGASCDFAVPRAAGVSVRAAE